MEVSFWMVLAVLIFIGMYIAIPLSVVVLYASRMRQRKPKEKGSPAAGVETKNDRH